MADKDPLEERLVQDAPAERRARAVGGIWSSRACQRRLQFGADVGGLRFGSLERRGRCLALLFEPPLLAGENFIGDKALVGHLNETKLVVLEVCEAPFLAPDVPIHDLPPLSAVGLDVGADLGLFRTCQRDRAVQLLNPLLDGGRRQVTRRAGPAELPAGAVDTREVLVLAAAPAGMDAEEHPSATFRTEQRSPQVVLVLGRTIGCVVAGGQLRLNLTERLFGDERLMDPEYAATAVLHDAVVVRVDQHLLQRGDADRLGPALRRRTAGEPPLFEMGREPDQRPVSRGVELKRLGNQGGPFRVEDHRADVLSPDEFALGHVAEGRAERRATKQVLLHEPLLDLGGEVVRVVLGKRRQHPVHQPAGWRLVDVLRRGHQLDPHTDEALVQHCVIESVAGQPVDLVDDQVLDAQRREFREHLLQHGAIVAAG